MSLINQVTEFAKLREASTHRLLNQVLGQREGSGLDELTDVESKPRTRANCMKKLERRFPCPSAKTIRFT